MNLSSAARLFLASPLLALVLACGGVTIGIFWSDIDRPPYSGIKDFRTVVVNDAASWAQLWAEHTALQRPAPPLPVVDFSSSTVVGVFLGSRPNGCYAVRIDEVRIETDIVQVYFSEHRPRLNEICTQAVTTPAHIVTISKTGLPFRFIKTD